MNIERDAKNIYVYAVSKRGYLLAKRIKTYINSAKIFTLSKYTPNESEKLKDGLKNHVDANFKKADLMIFVMSTGICVRMIKDSIEDKKKDPAIIVVDECGQNIISLLSGHIGGANDYARELSGLLEANPVITTATDLNEKWGIDTFSKENGFKLVDFRKAKLFTAYILENHKVSLETDFQIKTELKESFTMDESSKYKLVISNRNIESNEYILQLYKPNLVLGLGCKRGTSLEKLEKFIGEALDNIGYDINAVKRIASIDLKSNEKGILDIIQKHGWEFDTFPPEELKSVSNMFDKSKFVESITGTPAVAEPSGYLSSDCGACVLKKIKENGMTLSIWEEL